MEGFEVTKVTREELDELRKSYASLRNSDTYAKMAPRTKRQMAGRIEEIIRLLEALHAEETK